MPGDATLRTDAGGIAYTVRRSSRARRIRVRVDDRGVEVVVPRGSGERAAALAVRELRPWIERRLAELERARATVAARRGTVPYLGTTLKLLPEPARTRVHRRGDTLLVPDGPEQTAALERWYRRAAATEIAVRLDRACARAGTSYARLTIRGQRSRWASCSRTGTMSFNWRLLLAPESVLDYVVWHEVCHLEVMDHSSRFWRLVASRSPDYRDQVRWLKVNGATLVL
jgi:predicted metal-dependent hydrolase